MSKRLTHYALLLFFSFWSGLTLAQEEDGLGGEKVEYVDLKPPFVVNYGGQGRLKYLKVDVSIRVRGSKGANAVRHHTPYIRNNLVMLFSSQPEEAVITTEGKEQLRLSVKNEVKAVLQKEEGEDFVEDVLFANFIVQK